MSEEEREEEAGDSFYLQQIERLELEIRATKINSMNEGLAKGQKETALALLDLVDDCDRALQVLDSDPEAMRAGVEQMRARAIQRFAGLGLESFAQVGEEFDPYLHQAIASVPGGQGGMIAEVHQRGWRNKEGVVRTATVSVYEGEEDEL